MSYLYTETCTLPVSDLDDCTYICCCQLCTHHHFRCLPYYGHYWTYLRKRSFLSNRHNTYCCPLWFSWKLFQTLNSHKCVYSAIIHLSIIKRNLPRWLLLISQYLFPLLTSIIVHAIFFTSSSSSSSLPSPSWSLKSLLIWNYKLSRNGSFFPKETPFMCETLPRALCTNLFPLDFPVQSKPGSICKFSQFILTRCRKW